MSNNKTKKAASLIQSRFIDLLLSDKLALARLGIIPEVKTLETKRELLNIETQAQLQKQKQAATESEFKDYINEFFHDALFEYLDQRTSETDYLFSEILTIDPVLPQVMDACSAKATSASKLEELIQQATFLVRDVLNLVNNPPFRESNSNKAHVDNIGLAVRYVGVDNIKFALLTYIGRNWLPHSTEPFSDFKNKYWQYSLATANCCRALAKEQGLNECTAFLLGMIQGLGLTMTLRIYLRAFDTVRVAQMKKVVKAGRKDIEKVLDSLVLDHNFVSDALNKYQAQVFTQVCSQLPMKFAVLEPISEELAEGIAFDDAMPLTQILIQARSYVQYKMLQKSRLIELDEAKLFLTNAQINNSTIALLNQVDLKKLDLVPAKQQ